LIIRLLILKPWFLKNNIAQKLDYSFICTLVNFNNKTVMSDISSRVKAIIADKLSVDENEVTLEASFTNDLGADSLDTVELIMEFEKEFDIQIPDDQAENIATVGQAISYIEQATKA
jgi:acyl carrier protein